MVFHLHLADNLDNELGELERSGKKGRHASSQGKQILDALRTEGLRSKFAWCKRTKKGENRLSGCVKYDLGHGYRLITVHSGNHIFVAFVGTHDKADFWLEQNGNRMFSAEEPGFTGEKISLPEQSSPSPDNLASKTPEPGKQDSYEEQLLTQLDDSTLQTIFPGLIR